MAKQKKSSGVAYVKSVCGCCIKNDTCRKYKRLMEKDPIMYQTFYLTGMANCGEWKQNIKLNFVRIVDIFLNDQWSVDHRIHCDRYLCEYRNPSNNDEYRVVFNVKGDNFIPEIPKVITLKAKAKLGDFIYNNQEELNTAIEGWV